MQHWGIAARRRRAAHGLGALLAVTAMLAVPSGAHAAPSAPKPLNVTYGIGPATSRAPDRREYLNYDAGPGATLNDHVAVVNRSILALDLAVYPVDGTSGKDGSVGFAPRANPGTDARTWLTIGMPSNATTVHVPANGLVILPIAVHVPTNATPGDHLAAVIASITAIAKSPGHTKINFEQRVALRAYIRVAGDLRPQLSITKLTADYHANWNPFGAGSATVTYQVRNAGNVLLGGAQKISVTGIFGSTGSVHAVASVPMLLPGGSFPVKVIVHGVWPELFMHADVKVTPESVVGTVNPPLHVAHASASFFAIPWALLILIVLLAGAGYAVRRWLKKTRSGAPARHRPASEKKPALAGRAAS